MKQNTYAGYHVELGPGYVKDQIGEWEKLFMLRAATDEQLASTEAEGYRRLAERCIQNSDDVFTIGRINKLALKLTQPLSISTSYPIHNLTQILTLLLTLIVTPNPLFMEFIIEDGRTTVFRLSDSPHPNHALTLYIA